MYKKIIAVSSGIRTKHINIPCGQKSYIYLMLNLLVHVVTGGLYRVKRIFTFPLTYWSLSHFYGVLKTSECCYVFRGEVTEQNQVTRKQLCSVKLTRVRIIRVLCWRHQFPSHTCTCTANPSKQYSWQNLHVSWWHIRVWVIWWAMFTHLPGTKEKKNINSNSAVFAVL
jgi:hypothetical protein